MIVNNYPNLNNIDKLKDMPMIPVKLFKLINLKSIKEKTFTKSYTHLEPHLMVYLKYI